MDEFGVVQSSLGQYDFLTGAAISHRSISGTMLHPIPYAPYLGYSNVTFVKLDVPDAHAHKMAETFFNNSNLVNEKRIMKTCFPSAFNVRGLGLTICFQPFDSELNDNHLVSPKLSDGLLNPYWVTVISELLSAIDGMHSKECYHGGLSSHFSYVKQVDDIKILYVPRYCPNLSTIEKNYYRTIDYQDFGRLLRDLLHTGNEWQERDQFLNFLLDGPGKFEFNFDEYVEKIKGHPFFMSAKERLEYATILEKACFEHQDSLRGDRSLADFQGWNSAVKREGWPMFLQDVYNYVLDRNVHRGYEGNCLGLIRFCKNVAKHYEADMIGLDRVNASQAELALRRQFGLILESVHEVLS